MNFPELYQRLKREKGFADVWCDLYPDDSTPGGRYILRVEDGRYEAGSFDQDRGSWISDGVFDNEEDACEVIYKWTTWVAPVPEPDSRNAQEIAWGKFTTQVRIRSLAESLPYKRLLAGEIAAGRAPVMPESYRVRVWEPYQRSLFQDD